MSNVGWGPGTSSDPVGLRGVEYLYETKKPYEWFLKFNLHSYAGKYIESAPPSFLSYHRAAVVAT